jgi:hypothetical protein
MVARGLWSRNRWINWRIRLKRLDRTTLFIFLLATALVLAPAARAQQEATPIAKARANAESFLNRMVRVLVTPTSGESQTGFGFILGERATATGGPGFLVVTADHLVRGASNPQKPSAVRVLFYANLTFNVPAEVLDVHLPPAEGDLAVLVVPKRPIPELSAAAAGSSQALLAGMAAWQLGLPDQWTTPDVTGRFALREPTGWLYFDHFDGSPQSAGGAAITELGLAGMVVGNGAPTAAARVLPVELIITKFKEWGLLNLAGTRPPP